MAPLAAGEKRTCSCGTLFVGAKTLTAQGREGGSPKSDGVIPVTLAPDREKGNILLQQIDGVLRAVIFGHDDVVRYLRERGVQLRVSHFVDCPHAPQYRRNAPARPIEGEQ